MGGNAFFEGKIARENAHIPSGIKYPPCPPAVGESVKQNVKHDIFDCCLTNSYNFKSLGISLAVGRLTLDQLGQVRILDPQPEKG